MTDIRKIRKILKDNKKFLEKITPVTAHPLSDGSGMYYYLDKIVFNDRRSHNKEDQQRNTVSTQMRYFENNPQLLGDDERSALIAILQSIYDLI